MDFNNNSNNNSAMKTAAQAFRAAVEANDPDKIQEAYEGLGVAASAMALAEVQQDIEAYKQTYDEAILEKRGVRKLTTQETEWYNKIIDVMKSSTPKQAFVEIIGSDDEDDIMPSSIIDEVFKNLTEEHPLLSKVQTQSVGYLTKWIRNNHSVQSAAWGAITDAIEKEITSAFEVVEVKQNKLSCFAVLEKGMEDLGPSFLDSYIRTVLTEAMSVALETAIITGSGEGMPAGMDRSLLDADYTKGTGYAQKTAVTVTSFSPVDYGALLDAFTEDEKGHHRKFGTVTIICNQSDYLTKVMPATTVLNANGSYVNNLFPYATDVIISNVVEDGKALIGLMNEYTLFIGRASRNNVIEYSDEYKFIEDQRVFKVVQYADGRAFDNTSFQLLDISGLEPAYITVENVTTA